MLDIRMFWVLDDKIEKAQCEHPLACNRFLKIRFFIQPFGLWFPLSTKPSGCDPRLFFIQPLRGCCSFIHEASGVTRAIAIKALRAFEPQVGRRGKTNAVFLNENLFYTEIVNDVTCKPWKGSIRIAPDHRQGDRKTNTFCNPEWGWMWMSREQSQSKFPS